MTGKECMEIMNINQSSIMPTLGQSAELRVTKRDGRHEHLDLEKFVSVLCEQHTIAWITSQLMF